MRWAIVIGIDKYGGNVPNLNAAVHDAESFNRWVTNKTGANVPEENVRLLLGRTSSGTLDLHDERAGLRFWTRVAPRSSICRDPPMGPW